MARRCFISFKTEDKTYKLELQRKLGADIIDHSLDNAIDSDDLEYILRCIREDYLADSTVTIHLIGQHSAEYRGHHEQRFIKRELQASLYNGEGNSRNGILGIVLPSMYSTIYGGWVVCSNCRKTYTAININDATVIKEFSANYYIPFAASHKCSWTEEERYCVLVRWDDFIADPEPYIEQAYTKITSPIAERIIVRP